MLDTVIRDNEGNILGYRAHMAKGRHYLEQRKNKEALSHFLLLSRLTHLPGGHIAAETELYREALFQKGFHYQNQAFPGFSVVPGLPSRGQERQ